MTHISEERPSDVSTTPINLTQDSSVADFQELQPAEVAKPPIYLDDEKTRIQFIDLYPSTFSIPIEEPWSEDELLFKPHKRSMFHPARMAELISSTAAQVFSNKRLITMCLLYLMVFSFGRLLLAMSYFPLDLAQSFLKEYSQAWVIFGANQAEADEYDWMRSRLGRFNLDSPESLSIDELEFSTEDPWFTTYPFLSLSTESFESAGPPSNHITFERQVENSGLPLPLQKPYRLLRFSRSLFDQGKEIMSENSLLGKADWNLD
ncbi:hypothetical protein O181_018454 [Austropuccinia psidii MF-1]|uniref:Uncharacterized protein n=1 Tax=Austropuccinia psidii MF-1 TaxID=1389203 RepID=A0A9Q3C5B8_9BASI|nr:hypothetical protein [Austropuccinia psidii MF-1]